MHRNWNQALMEREKQTPGDGLGKLPQGRHFLPFTETEAAPSVNLKTKMSTASAQSNVLWPVFK